MKFVCDQCLTKYAIDDSRVRGKVLKVRCKACQHLITVREPTSVTPAPVAPGGASAPPAAARERDQTTLSPSPDPPPVATAPQPATASASRSDWYVSFDGEQEGPFAIERARERVATEVKAGREAFAWRDGFAAWLPAEKVPELQPPVAARPGPPPPPSRARPEATSRPPGRPQSKPDLVVPDRASEPLRPVARAAATRPDGGRGGAQAPGPLGSTRTPAGPLVIAPSGPTAVGGPSGLEEPTAPDARPAAATPGRAVTPAPKVGARPLAGPALARGARPTPAPRGGSSLEPRMAADAPSETAGSVVAAVAAAARARAEAPASAAAVEEVAPPRPIRSSEPAVAAVPSPSPAGVASAAAAPAYAAPIAPLVSGGARVDTPAWSLPSLSPAPGPAHGTAPSAPSLPPSMFAPSPPRRGMAIALAACVVIIVVLAGALGYQMTHKGPEVAVGSVTVAEAAAPRPPPLVDDRPVGLIDSAPRARPAVAVAPAASPPVAARGPSGPGRARPLRGGGIKAAEPSPRPEPPAAPAPLSAEQKRLAEMYRDQAAATPDRVPRAAAREAPREQVSNAEIMGVVTRSKKSVQLCFERTLKHDPSLRNLRVDVELKIGISGSVTSVLLTDPRIAGSELGTCLKQTIRRWHFPSQESEYQTAFPLLLQAQ